MIESKKWNHFIVVIGIPDSGKSDYGLRRACELGRTPAYVLAHDVAYRLPDGYHDDKGGKHAVVVHRHDTIEGGLAALATKPGGVHAFVRADAMEVLAAGKQVAERSLAKNGGTHLVPVVVLLDEGVLVSGASRYRLDEQMLQAVTLRRHDNVGVIITVQHPKYIHYSLNDMATEIVLFNIQGKAAIQRVVEMGVPERIAVQATQLPQYKYIHWKGGFHAAVSAGQDVQPDLPHVDKKREHPPATDESTTDDERIA